MSIGPRHEHIQCHRVNTVALRDHAALICIFLYITRCAAASLGGMRAASKTEYESAKRDFLLQTSVGIYAMTGHWWRRYYWYCHL